jgi:hypothetical protein
MGVLIHARSELARFGSERADPFYDVDDPVVYIERIRQLDAPPGDPVWPSWGIQAISSFVWRYPDVP